MWRLSGQLLRKWSLTFIEKFNDRVAKSLVMFHSPREYHELFCKLIKLRLMQMRVE